MFKHFGESVVELIKLDQSVADCLNAPENKAAFELLRESLGEDLGVIVVSGHIGNWELRHKPSAPQAFQCRRSQTDLRPKTHGLSR